MYQLDMLYSLNSHNEIIFVKNISFCLSKRYKLLLIEYNIFIFNRKKMLMSRGENLDGLGLKYPWGSDAFISEKSDADIIRPGSPRPPTSGDMFQHSTAAQTESF